jgi:TonB-linked SusC/RagA family outer membrane protein
MRSTKFLWKICLLTSLLISLSLQFAYAQQTSIDSIPSGKGIVDDLVDIGYGYQKKREVTNSITSVQSEDFNKGSINNPWQLIQGKVSGLAISKPGGDPNGSYEIRLRGLSTTSSNIMPLVVINGVADASLENVDPADIESISVLKDGASEAIYGIRGSEGVILITTKKGMPGKTLVEYNVYTSAETVAKNTPMMNSSEWRALSKETGYGTDFGENTNWFKQIEQTAISQVHNISLSGGTEKTYYRASINYRAGDGILINTGYSQLNGDINITQKVLKDKLTLDLNMRATERESQNGFVEAFRYAAISNPTTPVRSADPQYVNYGGYFQQQLFDYYNPVAIVNLDKNEVKNRIFNLSFKGTYEILKGLKADMLYSVQSGSESGGQYFSKYDFWSGESSYKYFVPNVSWGGYNRGGFASRKQDNSSNNLFESTIHYNSYINQSVNFEILGGYSYQDFMNEGFLAQGGNFLTDDFTFNNLAAALDFKNGKAAITSYKNSNKLIAYFGRINLNISDIWFISTSLRYEGSSKLGADNKWGVFPAIGTGVNLIRPKDEGFLNCLKLRADYGVTGNLPLESYLSLDILGPQGNIYYNGVFIPGYTISNKANPKLKWERKGEFNFGLDFSLLGSRISGSFDIYTRTAKDLIYKYYAYDAGSTYNFAENKGKLRSSGLETTLNYMVSKSTDFDYYISFTSSFDLKNTLVTAPQIYYGYVSPNGIQDIGFPGSPGGGQTALVRIESGKPIGQLIGYRFKGIDQNGLAIFEDVNKDGHIDYNDVTVVGNGLPKSMIGFNNSIRYKNWDLNIFFRGVFGHNLINSYREFYETPRMIFSYNVVKTAANIRNSDGKLAEMTFGTLSDQYVENASFLSLDNACLDYNFRLPEGSPISKIRLYMAGNNLFYITKYKGSDPNPRYGDSEFSDYDPLIPGIDRRNSWPRTRSVTFGVNVAF